MAAIKVAEFELFALFEAFELWDKAADGRLRATEEPRTRGPARFCLGGQSYFVRLYNNADRAVARIHYISCPDGRVLRWPSSVLVRGLTIYRAGHD